MKNAELPMSNVLHIYRMTYKTYDMQEYIFVHPEERFTSKPFFGIFRSILSRKATSMHLQRLLNGGQFVRERHIHNGAHDLNDFALIHRIASDC